VITTLPLWATIPGTDDYALANIGQTKNLFSFALPDQTVVVMEALYAQQNVASAELAPLGIAVNVTQAGSALTEASVTFEVFEGSGGLVNPDNLSMTPLSTLTTETDAQGKAMCEFQATEESGFTWIKASTPGATFQWFLMTVAGGSGTFPTNPANYVGVNFIQDSNGNGIPDAAENLSSGGNTQDQNQVSPFVITYDSWTGGRVGPDDEPKKQGDIYGKVYGEIKTYDWQFPYGDRQAPVAEQRDYIRYVELSRACYELLRRES
jgi:hypothetical protein